jgi:cardiolipin synthase
VKPDPREPVHDDGAPFAREGASPRLAAPSPLGAAFRLRDLLSTPSMVSLSRLPLALLFATSLERPRIACALLAAAGLSDILDGWLARRTGRVTATGALLDPIVDKLFVVTATLALLRAGHLAAADVLRLAAREFGELPVLARALRSRGSDSRGLQVPRSNHLGKAATMLQFASLVAAVLRSTWLDSLLWATAVGGMMAALGYWSDVQRAPVNEPR